MVVTSVRSRNRSRQRTVQSRSWQTGHHVAQVKQHDTRLRAGTGIRLAPKALVSFEVYDDLTHVGIGL